VSFLRKKRAVARQRGISPCVNNLGAQHLSRQWCDQIWLPRNRLPKDIVPGLDLHLGARNGKCAQGSSSRLAPSISKQVTSR